MIASNGGTAVLRYLIRGRKKVRQFSIFAISAVVAGLVLAGPANAQSNKDKCATELAAAEKLLIGSTHPAPLVNNMESLVRQARALQKKRKFKGCITKSKVVQEKIG